MALPGAPDSPGWVLLKAPFLPTLSPAPTPPRYLFFLASPQALVNFFHAEGQGLPLESLRDGSYKVRFGPGASDGKG